MSRVRTDRGEAAPAEDVEPALRIGEVARRCGVAPATLRAWERRYGVVAPVRGASGYRLYSAADQRRVRAMRELVDAGIAPAEAAARVREGGDEPGPADAAGPTIGPEAQEELIAALLGFDEGTADELLDRALAAFTTDAVLDGLVLPVLREIGDRWSRGDASVSQEHFASGLLRGRLLGLARGWGGGSGPLALLACPGGERHDLGLIAFGLALRGRGWRVSFLGPDTPVSAIVEATERVRPDVVVLYAREPERFLRVEPELVEISARSNLLLAGPGAGRSLSAAVGAGLLLDGPVEAASHLTA